jgi:hypothetical protein
MRESECERESERERARERESASERERNNNPLHGAKLRIMLLGKLQVCDKCVKCVVKCLWQHT